MIKRIIGIVIFLLVMNAGARLAMFVYHDQELKDGVRETALFAQGKTDDALKARVMQLAQEQQIPLDPDYVEVIHRMTPNGDVVTIKFAYAKNLALAPGYTRRMDISYQVP
jgi:hypothetical protein